MAKKPAKLRPEPDREPRDQYAALPWRRAADGTPEVLLITSRETRRWVIPKGWPMKGLKSPQCAAREAFEEAGVEGELRKKKLGVFHYEKRLRSGRVQPVKVAVYAMKVTAEHEAWPEKGQRDKRWTSAADAATQVDEPELRALIAAFSPS
jgi:8-oxo-dGTP pyrophosphatase MutT (NUDIX family)